jgi:hypothetical protein
MGEVKRWLAAVLPLLKPLLYENGGPVIAVQVGDNGRTLIEICIIGLQVGSITLNSKQTSSVCHFETAGIYYTRQASFKVHLYMLVYTQVENVYACTYLLDYIGRE